MKILGVGVDLVSNKRIQLLIKNKNFLKRTFGPNELKFSKKNIACKAHNFKTGTKNTAGKIIAGKTAAGT